MKTAKGKEKGKDGKGDKNAKNADKEKQRKFIVRRVPQIFPSAVDSSSATHTRPIVCRMHSVYMKNNLDYGVHLDAKPDEVAVPEHPEMAVFASFTNVAKYPPRISALGEMADTSERLRQVGL